MAATSGMHTLAGLALAASSVLAAPQAAAPKETPAYVAVCREVRQEVFPRGAGMRIELLAALQDGTLQTVELGVVAAPAPIVSRIRGLEWHFLAPDGSTGRAERFGDARLVYGWNEPEEDGEAPGIGDDSALLVLGACETPGTVYATRALSRPRTSIAGARDDRRVREEMHLAGKGGLLDVVQIGDAVIGRGAVVPDRAKIDAEFERYSAEQRREMGDVIERSAGSIGVFTLLHPDLAAPLRIGDHMGYAAQSVILSAIVTIGGEDFAIVVSNHSSFEASDSVTGSVIQLKTGIRYDITLAGAGC